MTLFQVPCPCVGDDNFHVVKLPSCKRQMFGATLERKDPRCCKRTLKKDTNRREAGTSAYEPARDVLIQCLSDNLLIVAMNLNPFCQKPARAEAASVITAVP